MKKNDISIAYKKRSKDDVRKSSKSPIRSKKEPDSPKKNCHSTKPRKSKKTNLKNDDSTSAKNIAREKSKIKRILKCIDDTVPNDKEPYKKKLRKKNVSISLFKLSDDQNHDSSTNLRIEDSMLDNSIERCAKLVDKCRGLQKKTNKNTYKDKCNRIERDQADKNAEVLNMKHKINLLHGKLNQLEDIQTVSTIQDDKLSIIIQDDKHFISPVNRTLKTNKSFISNKQSKQSEETSFLNRKSENISLNDSRMKPACDGNSDNENMNDSYWYKTVEESRKLDTKEIKELRNILTNKDKEHFQLKKIIENLHQELKKYQLRNCDLEECLKEFKGMTRELQNQIDGLESDRNKFISKNNSKNHQLEEQMKELAKKLQNQNIISDNEKQSLTLKYKSRTLELEEQIKDLNKTLQKQISTSENEKLSLASHYNEDINHYKNEVIKLNDLLNDYTKKNMENEDMQDKLTEREVLLTELNEKLKFASKNISQLKIKNDKINKENEHILSKIDLMKSENSHLKNKFCDMSFRIKDSSSNNLIKDSQSDHNMLNNEVNYEKIESPPLPKSKIKEISTKQKKPNNYPCQESITQTNQSDFDEKCQKLKKFSNDLNVVMDQTLASVNNIKKSDLVKDKNAIRNYNSKISEKAQKSQATEDDHINQSSLSNSAYNRDQSIDKSKSYCNENVNSIKRKYKQYLVNEIDVEPISKNNGKKYQKSVKGASIESDDPNISTYLNYQSNENLSFRNTQHQTENQPATTYFSRSINNDNYQTSDENIAIDNKRKSQNYTNMNRKLPETDNNKILSTKPNNYLSPNYLKKYQQDNETPRRKKDSSNYKLVSMNKENIPHNCNVNKSAMLLGNRNNRNRDSINEDQKLTGLRRNLTYDNSDKKMIKSSSTNLFNKRGSRVFANQDIKTSTDEWNKKFNGIINKIGKMKNEIETISNENNQMLQLTKFQDLYSNN